MPVPDPRPPATRWRWLRRVLVGAAALYLVVCAAVFLLQDALVFHPTTLDADDVSAPHPTLQPLEVEVDGATLHGVLVPGAGEGPRPTLLYLGGNAAPLRGRA